MELDIDASCHAVVQCVDERSRIQALECTQPMLPMGLGYVKGVTQRAIRRGSFSSVKQLTGKINRLVNDYNSKTRPFVWTATADSILAQVERLSKLICGTAH